MNVAIDIKGSEKEAIDELKAIFKDMKFSRVSIPNSNQGNYIVPFLALDTSYVVGVNPPTDAEILQLPRDKEKVLAFMNRIIQNYKALATWIVALNDEGVN
ncbi:MAG: hypothetical protein AAFP92_13920 [Bacteroidota bacterium]